MFSFSPLPHETDADETKFHSWKRVKWQGETWELALRDYNNNYYLALNFRRRGGPLLGATTSVKAPLAEGKRGVAPDAMWERFVECQSNGRWERSFYWNEDFGLRRTGEKAVYATGFTPHGRGGWVEQGVYPPHHAGFHWQQEQTDFLSRASSAELLEILKSAPDFEFARRYLSERSEMYWPNAWTWRRGDHTEFERILTWALLAQEDLWLELGNLSLSVDLTRNWHSNEEQLGAILFSDKQGCHSAENPTPWTPEIHQALSTALEWFGPQVNQTRVDEHLCLQQSLGWGCLFRIEPKNFTAHEQIEASVKWREWLANAKNELDK